MGLYHTVCYIQPIYQFFGSHYKEELDSPPFNMYTSNKMWRVGTLEEIAAKIEGQKLEVKGEPKNLKEQAISLVGRDVYEKLVKGYTEKQWGRNCKDLSAFIIKRLHVRLTFDNNYFNVLYQEILVGGYTNMSENILDGVEVRIYEDYLKDKAKWDGMVKKVVYIGSIDAYFDYSLGILEYRGVRGETEVLDKLNFQGNTASIIPIGKHHEPASLSTSSLSSGRTRTEMNFQRQ